MKENEIQIKNAESQKARIRERYKGVDLDELDVIPAIPQENFYERQCCILNADLYSELYLRLLPELFESIDIENHSQDSLADLTTKNLEAEITSFLRKDGSRWIPLNMK